MDTHQTVPDVDVYLTYLYRANPDFDLGNLDRVGAIFDQTHWQTPRSPLDFNNLAVMALVQAEDATPPQRQALLEQASKLLQQGGDHPLCIAHGKLISTLIWQTQGLWSETFIVLLETLQMLSLSDELPLGLIYLPSNAVAQSKHSGDLIEPLFALNSGQEQALVLLSEVTCRANLCFYNESGLRSLRLQSQLLPHTPRTLLKLGLAHWLNAQVEGLVCLHRAHQRAPGEPAILQALHLLYCTLQESDRAAEWQQQGLTYSARAPEPLAWAWTQLPPEAPFTYLPFEGDMVLATERTLSSIVTSVLLAEGDWFEKEMEFWRFHIQPGMVVMDVGANAGVYTFSAAKRVGRQGRVIAIEPFLGCQRCLQETCRINAFEWVTVYAGAASDRTGTLKLSIGNSSELNAVVSDAAIAESSVQNSAENCIEEVACITLDDLVMQEQLTRVDVIKLDAERHEIPVLQGSERLLREFRPVILYENSSADVADFLRARDYILYYYQPYLQNLVQLQADDDYAGTELNLIAFPNPVPGSQ